MSLPEPNEAGQKLNDEALAPSVADRAILLRAAEIAYRNPLISKLTSVSCATSHRSCYRTQARSNGVLYRCALRTNRRHIEAVGDSIETFGFAGFFGVPMAYRSLGAASASSQLPVLLKPKFEVAEGLATQPEYEAIVGAKRQVIRSVRKVWKQFQTAALSCFSFIESAGWLYGYQLTKRTLKVGDAFKPHLDGQHSQKQTAKQTLGPTFAGLAEQGMGLQEQANLAQSILKNLGSAVAWLDWLCSVDT